VAVIGVPDARWGEATEAMIVARPGESVSEAEIVALPKNAYGKVLKRELRDRFWTERARKV